MSGYLGAQGSAGRRPKLGVGTLTRRGHDGIALYGPTDAAAVLGLPAKQIHRMLDAGSPVAISRLVPPASNVCKHSRRARISCRSSSPTGHRWVTETELSRCEAALQAGTSPRRDRRPRPARRAAQHRRSRPAGRCDPPVPAQARQAPRGPTGRPSTRRSPKDADRATLTWSPIVGRQGRWLVAARRARRVPRTAAAAGGTGRL